MKVCEEEADVFGEDDAAPFSRSVIDLYFHICVKLLFPLRRTGRKRVCKQEAGSPAEPLCF